MHIRDASEKDPFNIPPRREQTTRKAKAKGIVEIIGQNSQEQEEEEPFADSDTDPIWTPAAEYEDEDGKSKKKKGRQRKPKGANSGNTSFSTNIADSGLFDDDSDDDSDAITTKIKRKSPIKVSDKFSVGDFVMLTSEQYNKTPMLWQIDTKSILQKYEPFVENGVQLYKSKPMFTTWRGNTKEFYTKVDVRKCYQNGDEKVIKMLLTAAQIANAEFTEKIMNDFLDYHEHFTVYLQALISQALNNEFLSDVGSDDDYFYPSISAVDNNIMECQQKILSTLSWSHHITFPIVTWPNYNIISEMEMDKYQCVICSQSASMTFSMGGESYDRNTMLAVATNRLIESYNKNITMCHKCITQAESLHKVTHEKYNLLQTCSKRVQELSETVHDSTDILRQLLTSYDWITELFQTVRAHWTEAHCIERLNQLANTQ